MAAYTTPLSVSMGDTSKETAVGKLASMFVLISIRSVLRGISLQNMGHTQ
jgi:hypothetical protein